MDTFLKMRFWISSILMVGTFSFLLSSCSTYTYRYKPTTVKAPLFEEKGDFEIGLTASELYGLNGAYAITNHIAIGAGFGLSESADSITIKDTLGFSLGDVQYIDNQIDYELAVNYFNKIPSTNLTYEVQLGFGINERVEEVKGDFDRPSTLYNFEKRNSPIYNRVFIQPAIGKNGKYFDWSFATRFQVVSYKDLAVRYPLASFENYSDLVVEPVFTVRGGYKFIKLMFQAGARIGFAHDPYDYVPVHLGAGIVVPINKNTVQRKSD